VWWQNGTDAWQKMKTPFVYYDTVTLLGLLKRCVAAVVVLGVVLTVISTLAGGLHKLSGRCPRLTMVMHAVVLVVVSSISIQIIVDFESPLTRFAATHMLLEAMTSPLMVYTPEKEQRIRLKRDAVKYCRLLHAKRLAVWLYGVRMLVCTPVAVLGMCDAAWVALDAEFDLLIGLAVCVMFMAAMHAVAFVTGVHGVEIPLGLNDHTIVHTEESVVGSVHLGSLPVVLHGTGWVSKAWRPTSCRVYGATMLRSGTTASAIVLWDLGTIRYGRVRLERVVVSKSVYVANGSGDLEKFGQMNAKGVLCRDNDVSIVSRVLGFILWVHTNNTDDDEQNLNMVHNLRAQSHRMQKGCCCVRCAVVWWVAIAACLLAHGVLVYYVWDSSIRWLLVVETLGIVVALDFGMLVATRGVAVAPTKLRGGKTCPQHHTTVPMVVNDNGWVCDTCQRALGVGESTVYCSTCDWAQCEVCGV